MLNRSLSIITNRSNEHEIEVEPSTASSHQNSRRGAGGIANLLNRVNTLLSRLSTVQKTSDSDSTGSSSSENHQTENKMQLLLWKIEDVSKNYKSDEIRIQRVKKWLSTVRSDGTLPWAIKETEIEHPIEHQTPETPAESLVREKQAVYLSLLNHDQDSDEETESEESFDDQRLDKTGSGPFMFSPGRAEFRDLLFMRVLTTCQPFYAEEGVLRAFLRCAHLLTTSQATRSFFTGFPIRRREKVLYGRYRVLKAWIVDQDQWIHIDHGTSEDDQELRKLILEMIPGEIEYSRRDKRRDDYSPPASSCGSVSSCRSTLNSSVWA